MMVAVATDAARHVGIAEAVAAAAEWGVTGTGTDATETGTSASRPADPPWKQRENVQLPAQGE